MQSKAPRIRALLAGLAVLAAGRAALAQTAQPYQVPPQVIQDLVIAERPPLPQPDPHCRYLALLKRPGFKALEELAQPELRLGGLRINPLNHDLSRGAYFVGLSLQDIASGREIPVAGLPSKLRLEHPGFSPDGRHLAFVEVQAEGLALWVLELATGQARRLSEPLLSGVLGSPYAWASDGASLYVRVRPSAAPYTEARALPTGPAVQESVGGRAPARTYQDLLRTESDERRFEFYTTVAVRRIDLAGREAPVLPPAMVQALRPSPDGRYLLVQELHRPFSYQFPLDRFPLRVRITDAAGAAVAEVCDKPLRDRIPVDFDAAEEGRRHVAWREDQPSTLVWAEALDGGDPAREVPHRDAVFQWPAPFQGEPRPLFRTRDRFEQVLWGDDHMAIAVDGWWKTRRSRYYRVDPSASTPDPQPIFDFSTEDLYHLPGDFSRAPNGQNRWGLRFSKDHRSLFLEGEGYTPEGNRPFLDAYDLATGRTRRLWQADGKSSFEEILRLMDPEKGVLLTRVQGPKTYPNLYLRTYGRPGEAKALTRFTTPYQALEGVKKETLHYRREDGVDLTATLYLPPGYEAGRDGRLPLLMEAYPTEFKDPKAAGMVRESPHAFITPSWGSPVFWALRGYAVLENAQFPIVGQGKAEPNDSYVEQLVMDARAAIREVDRRGVVDPKRAACVGHSYGAFMVANLLAHSDLFAAGIARSGAYNRTLTPFGFQSEERTYWQAQDVYQKMSPFNFADHIKAPLLLIHGDADNNPGTFTLQSERLFQAVKGLGGKARLVLLPLEAHGYAARENILHMLWEEDAWLEKYVKGAGR